MRYLKQFSRYTKVFWMFLLTTSVAFGQSSFDFVNETLPTTNATEHIAQASAYAEADGDHIYDHVTSGPFAADSSATGVASIAPKVYGSGMVSTSETPDSQSTVGVLSAFNETQWIDTLYVDNYANVQVGTTSFLRKGWRCRDITPEGNAPPTKCLGADVKLQLAVVTYWGGWKFDAGVWVTDAGQHWSDARHLADIRGGNGLLGGEYYGLVILDSQGLNDHGDEYGPNIQIIPGTDNFVWQERFPQIQPGKVLWLMGPRKGDGTPHPHAVFTQEHYSWYENYGSPCGTIANPGLGFYNFEGSLLASWNGGGGPLP